MKVLASSIVAPVWIVARSWTVARSWIGARSCIGAGFALLTLQGLGEALPAVPASLVQGGYTEEERPELGLSFRRARDYEEIPVEPTEKWVVLQYVEKVAFRERDRKRVRPRFQVVWIEREPERARPVEDEGAEVEPERTASGGAAAKKPAPIDSFERYVEQVLSGWKLAKREALDTCPEGFSAEELGLQATDVAQMRAQVRGWARVYEGPKKTIAMIGFCGEEDYDDQAKIWRKMTDRLAIEAPEARDLAKIERLYSRVDLLDEDYRVKVRAELPRSWEAEDTENYIVVFNTKDQPLIRIVQRELEAIRAEYVKLFPATREITAVSTVRICKDQEEYLQYGGFPGSGGYWNYLAEELVFFDYENKDGKAGTGKADSRIVLYHEAFHQYIYYAVGEIAPHTWYNEGNGDYFSGARMSGSKVQRIGPNPWRLGYIKSVIEAGKEIPWTEITAMTKPEFYRPDRRGICYAQAWSMVYFLRESGVARKHPVWSKILDTYFVVLRDTYAERSAGYSSDPKALTAEQKQTIGDAARSAAHEAAFADVDIFEIQDAWRKFVLDLKD